MTVPTPPPSPELRAILKQFCDIQRAKYGEDWKKKLAAELAAESTPVLYQMLKRLAATTKRS